MDRLTERDNQGKWQLKGVSWEELKPGAVISRNTYEKLYGALCKLKDYEDVGLNLKEVEQVNDFEQSQKGHLLKKLNTEQQKHRWIPVYERLPETEEVVLIQVSGKPRKNITFYNAFELASYSEELGWILEEYPEWEDAHPVAWQPLPEPYKGE